MKVFVVVIAASLITLTGKASAQSRPKPPWEWTDSERLAERFDPEKARERALAHIEDIKKRGRFEERSEEDKKLMLKSVSAPNIVVDGSRNPELLMPCELFDMLIKSAYGEKEELAQDWRKIYRQRAAERGFWIAKDFWAVLENDARPFIEATRARMRLAKQHPRASEAELNAAEQAICATRAQALQRAIATSGPGMFIRFLYSGVAPGVLVQGTDSPGLHLRMARGCQ